MYRRIKKKKKKVWKVHESFIFSFTFVSSAVSFPLKQYVLSPTIGNFTQLSKQPWQLNEGKLQQTVELCSKSLRSSNSIYVYTFTIVKVRSLMMYILFQVGRSFSSSNPYCHGNRRIKGKRSILNWKLIL